MAFVDSHTRFPFQQSAFAAALLKASSGDVHVVSAAGVGSFIFRKTAEQAVSLVEGAGILSPPECLQVHTEWPLEIANTLEVKSLYFPLVYQGTTAFEALRSRDDVWMVERRPSCAITLPVPEGSLLQRSVLRIGQRAQRRIDRFKRVGGDVVTLNNDSAVDAVEWVERKSWKRQKGQDMLSRNQFGFFAELIRMGSMTVRVARVEDRPIAYRLDCKIESRVYSIKWSFDEDFRALSPGFYMIVFDLDEYYRYDSVNTFDLYGSPDTLKTTVCDVLLPRFDFIWPATVANRLILAQREEFDSNNAHWLDLGIGIRRNYDAG